MSFKPMLAAKAKPEKLQFPLIVQPKLDGIRCSIVDGVALSRTLKPIPNKEISEFLSRDEFSGLDGELVVGPVTAEDCYRKTASFVMAPNKTGEDWAFVVFDKHDEQGGYLDRHEAAQMRLSWSGQQITGKVIGLDYLEVADAEELEAYETQVVEAGGEGVIIRSYNAAYKFGRGSVTAQDLLKLKRFIDFEAEVIGVYEELHNGNEAKTNALGRTERSSVKANKTGKGTLGGFIVKAINGPTEGVEFRVGTGFDAAQRADYWAMWHAGSLPGKIITVKSFPVGVLQKPRHPVFMHFRDVAAGA